MSRLESSSDALEKGGILFKEVSEISDEQWRRIIEAEAFLKGLSGEDRRRVLVELEGESAEIKLKIIATLISQKSSE